MAVSVTTLTNHLKSIMPKGYDTTTTPFTTWITEAIAEMVALAAPEFRERTWFDAVGDGVTTRYALPGFDVALAPNVPSWAYPHTQNNLASVTGGATVAIANPTTAPTLALRTGGSTIASGAVLAAAVAWTTANGRESQLSPFAVIATTAANQTIDVTATNVPSTVSKMHVYTSIDVANFATLGRAATNVATNVASTGLGLGAATATTLPLYNYADPTTVAFTEGTVTDGVVDTEYNEDVTGRGPTDLTAAGVQSVVMLDTALTLGQALRIWYYRAPQLPASGTTALTGIPDDFAYTATTAFMHRYLALNHETTSKDQHWQAYLDLHNQALAMKSNTAARPTKDVRLIQWGTQQI
jgi:hypothetical protein